MKQIEIYTTGISINQHGISGYGVLIIDNWGQKTQLSQSFKHSTSNRMQLLACIESLKALQESCIVKMYSTSKYIIDSINCNWVSNWKRKGWENSSGDKIQNKDLWLQLLSLLKQYDVEFIWISTKYRNPYIDLCNAIARCSINDTIPIIDTGYNNSRIQFNLIYSSQLNDYDNNSVNDGCGEGYSCDECDNYGCPSHPCN